MIQYKFIKRIYMFDAIPCFTKIQLEEKYLMNDNVKINDRKHYGKQ